MTYKIKPLQWEMIRNDWWRTETILGSISIQSDNGAYSWRYCFDEYYDEGSHSCDSIEAGKKEAEAFYLSRLLPALEACHD